MALAVLSASCTEKDNKDRTSVIGKHTLKIEDGLLTPEILWSFGRLGGVQVSPDGRKILYSVSYYSVPENKSNSELFVMNVDGSDKKQITCTAVREAGAKWMNDSEHIVFLSGESGSMQLWKMKRDGTNRMQLTNREGSINDFAFSPDGNKLLFVADVKYGQRTVDVYPDLDKTSGIIVNDLMYKHWDEWAVANSIGKLAFA